MSYLLIVGAKSDIAKALARKYAANGYDLYLAARNSSEQEAIATDLNVRFERKVQCVELDVLNYESHQGFYDSLAEKPIGVVMAAGYLGDQLSAQSDLEETQKIIATNFTSAVSLLNIIANDFEQRKSGFIIGISSVAGDRGRKSNYIYGAAKAGFSAYLSGLRNRLNESGVQVLTVKPGFVATKMTEGMDLPEKLTATSEQVSNDIFKAQQAGRDCIYTLWLWRWIMLIIKTIPESLFKKLSI